MSKHRPPFTSKEVEYLKINYGKSNIDLAKHFKCSVHMVKNYKLALKNDVPYKEVFQEKVPKKRSDYGGRDKQMRAFASELGYTLTEALGKFGRYEFIRMFENSQKPCKIRS